ncbi:Lrp/AsnC family transcriptional regulator [Profundibacterium mesophilum]|uniref:Transcriptional regulator AsnC family protein n=1 Tax=Profundibacterium mesophilum KAUST100406-0324 TaxID=1037889 RepID=A0A921NVD8_9RHOB|nr:Lrp/AsnC family transcriptional regulator [Profundibacterium mesophilum]KAF0677389.1 Transcriptional regulator AsnC family protein [Profundibacterium mesophilum KAUST100406-0324]
MLDDTDRRLLRQLQSDPAATVQALAARAGVGVAMATRRFERLRQAGILKGQRGVIDWTALGYAVRVSLRFTLDKAHRDAFDMFLAAARQVPEVVEIQTFLGRVDVRLAVIARDMPHYQDIYRKRILALPHIADIESLMHVATIKTDERLPI